VNSQDPEQTAIFAIVPTEEASRILALLESDSTNSASIETYTLPSSQDEAEHVAARMLGRAINHIAPAYVVTPHKSKPMSFIKNVVSGEEIEVITKENFQAVSRDLNGNSKIGAGLANNLLNPLYMRGAVLESYLERYIISYRPKYASYRALRTAMAGQLLASYDKDEINVHISKRGRELFAHVCELIEADPDTTA
jgi:hypothetical protein